MIIPTGRSQHGSVHADTPENTAQMCILIIQPPRNDTVPILARPGHGISLFPGLAEHASEALPSARDAVGTFGSCIASPLHRSQNPHCQRGYMMQQLLRQVLGQNDTSENLSNCWLSTLGTWMLWSVSFVRNVRH